MKDLMLQALNEMDKIFYNSVDEILPKDVKLLGEATWDTCYRTLEDLISGHLVFRKPKEYQDK